MRLISLEHVKSHMLLGRTIYDAQGRILLAKGAPLSDHYIRRLKGLGIHSLYVEDGTAPAIEIEDVVADQTRLEAIKATRDAIAQIKTGAIVTSRKLQKAVTDIIDDLLTNREIIIQLTDIRTMQDYTFGHSVNVCVLSVMTGMALGYNQLRLKELGSGALLHDVGKAWIDETLLNSERIFTPEEFMRIQQHTNYGFEILSKTENISSIAAHVAWQHHERYNGKGYPRGLAKGQIHEFARIVAVADVYDALTTDRPYRNRMMPYEVIEIIRCAGGNDFDPEVVECFIKNIAVFPRGCLVRLNNGQKGVVVKVKKDFPTRPAVRLLSDEKGRRIEGEEIIDLMTNLTVFVVEVLKDE